MWGGRRSDLLTGRDTGAQDFCHFYEFLHSYLFDISFWFFFILCASSVMEMTILSIFTASLP